MNRARNWTPLFVYAFAMVVVFRAWIGSGFDLGFGDRADGIIEISLLEHWRNVFLHAETWNRPIYFWPHPDTLGYNDGYLLFGIDYTLWRLVADPFRADMLNVLVFKTIGYWTAWWLARRTLSLGRGWSLLIALLFTIGSGMMHQAVHAQLQTIALVPVAAILAVAAVRAEGTGHRRRARLLGFTLALLMAAWLITAFYTAWFTLFFASMFGLCWVVTSRSWRGAELVALAKRHGLTAVIVLSTFAVFVGPFLIVYLPKASESGSHPMSDVGTYLTWLYDVANAGEDNYLWGWTLYPFRLLFGHIGGKQLADDHLGYEHASGFPVILLILILTAIATMTKRRSPPLVRAFALAIGITWALTIQAGVLSPWLLVYLFVPGASGLRVVLRYQLFLLLPALLLVAIAYRKRAERLMQRRPILLSALVGLLIVEQLSPVGSAALSRARQRELLLVPPPPRDCRSFYVVYTRRAAEYFHNRTDDAVYPHNVDAMFLAERWRVPTLNGFATFVPPDWAFGDRTAADYDARAARYISAHRLRGVCRFDARSGSPWSRVG